MDTLTLTIRLHDPKEKNDPEMSASWIILKIPREDITMPAADFVAKYFNSDVLKGLKNLPLQ